MRASDLLTAARAAVRPTIRLGRVVAVWGLNEYDVQVPGHVDAYGVEIPLKNLRSLGNVDVNLGDQVYVAQLNSNRPREGALWCIIAQEQQVVPVTPVVLPPWWPAHRQTQQRQSRGYGGAVSFSGLSVLTLSGDKTTLLRISGSHIYQVCLAHVSSVWREIVRAWPLNNPPNPYVPAWSQEMSDTTSPVIAFAVLFDGVPGLSTHAGSSALLRVAASGGITQSGSSFASVFEPVQSSRQKLLAVSQADVDSWTWKRIEPVGLGVSTAFTTTWSDWSVATTLPNSTPPTSYPIFVWNDSFSALDIKSLPLVSVVSDEAKRLFALPTDDPTWLTAAADDRAHLLEHENDANRNIAHLFSRGELHVIDEYGATVWKKDFRKTAAAADLEGLYGGVSPLISLTLSGRPVLFSHYVRNAFSTQALKTIIYRSDLDADIDALTTTDTKAFANTTWPTNAPAPPWSWKDDYIDSRITYYLGQWTTTFNTVTRDVQSESHHGFVAHDMSNGSFVARRAFKRDPSEPVGRRGTRLYATSDTGDPGCDVHDEVVSPHAPRKIFTGAVSTKVGVTSSAVHTLRSVLGLTDDEYVVAYIAKETYTGTTWTAWSIQFLYYFGAGFDSRFSPGAPAYDYSTTPPGTITVPAPYWENETNEFGLVSAYPFGNYSNGNPYQILGNATTGYQTVSGVSTFYTAHARYCLDLSGGEVTFTEPTIGFTNFTDPLGNFDHFTSSIEYHAIVVTRAKIPCDVADITYGWNPFNVVSDGDTLYCLPRVVEATAVDIAHPFVIDPPQPSTMACEVLMMPADLSSKTVITLDAIHTLTVHPVGLAVAETVGGRRIHSHLYVWCAGTNASNVRVGKLYHLVDGAVAESLTITGSDTWTGAQLAQADSEFSATSDSDSALYLSGSGTGGKLVRIGLHNGYFNV